MTMESMYHMSINIEGFLRNYKNKKMTGLMTDDNGKPMSDGEVRLYLHNCQVNGWKKLPMGECEGFDHFGGGCPGHKTTESND